MQKSDCHILKILLQRFCSPKPEIASLIPYRISSQYCLDSSLLGGEAC